MLSRTTRTFVAVAAAHALVDLFGGIWPVFKSSYLADLNLAKAGLIATVTGVVGTAVQPIFGLWADRGHRRKFVLGGLAASAAGMLLGPVAIHLDQLGDGAGYLLMFAILLLVRVGQGAFHPAATGLAGSTGPARRSFLVATFIACGGLGFSVSQLLFAEVYMRTGGHTEWLLLPGAAGLAWVWAWLRPAPLSADPPTFRRMAQAIRSAGRPLMLLFVVLTLMAALNFALLFLLPELVAARGYPEWLGIGGASLALILGSVVVMVPAGHLADRFDRRAVLLVVLALSVATYFGLLALPATAPAWAFLLACLVAGACIGTANPLGVALGQHLAPESASTISAILMGLAWAIGSFSPGLTGTLVEYARLSPTGALAVMGVTSAAALVAAFFLPQDHRPARETTR